MRAKEHVGNSFAYVGHSYFLVDKINNTEKIVFFLSDSLWLGYSISHMFLARLWFCVSACLTTCGEFCTQPSHTLHTIYVVSRNFCRTLGFTLHFRSEVINIDLLSCLSSIKVNFNKNSISFTSVFFFLNDFYINEALIPVKERNIIISI